MGMALAAARATAATAGAAGETFGTLEAHYGGRLGVFALDLGNGTHLAHRSDEAFPMCSTFKVLAVAAILARARDGKDRLSRPISFGARDLLRYAPVTRKHIGRDGTGTMTLGALCAAAIEYSDNAAANLLLASLGGPARVTDFARSLGDSRTRLDRIEPALNEARPGDPRDTTTPSAMAHDLRRLVFGEALGPYANLLRTWMLSCKTSAERIPAGLPPGWRSGNKTGSGDYATANDVAFLLPPHGSPKIVAAFFTGSHAQAAQQDETLAGVGRIVTRHMPWEAG